MGYCSGAQAPGFASAPGRGGFRQGFGQGGLGRGGARGMGRGGFRGVWRQGFVPADPVGPLPGVNTPEMERQDLRQQAMTLEASLEALKARLANLEKGAAQG
jgi:hypothetical protein